jgi:hypothetical protein
LKDEEEINKGRTGDKVIVAWKNGKKFFLTRRQLRKKFHHVQLTKAPLPKGMDPSKFKKLIDNKNQAERLSFFLDTTQLPDRAVEDFGKCVRAIMQNPNTKMEKVTFGANAEAKGGRKKLNSYHLYDRKTRVYVFMNDDGSLELFHTLLKLTVAQERDLDLNNKK